MHEAASGQELELSFLPPTTIILGSWICDEPNLQSYAELDPGFWSRSGFTGKMNMHLYARACKFLGTTPSIVWKDLLLLYQMSLHLQETIIKIPLLFSLYFWNVGLKTFIILP